MSDDLIKKSEPIALVSEPICPTGNSDYDNGREDEREAIKERLMALPSADRPQGEWKFVGSSIEMIWECPFCGEHTFGFEEHLPNYCSNCGADMRKGVDV